MGVALGGAILAAISGFSNTHMRMDSSPDSSSLSLMAAWSGIASVSSFIVSLSTKPSARRTAFRAERPDNWP